MDSIQDLAKYCLALLSRFFNYSFKNFVSQKKLLQGTAAVLTIFSIINPLIGFCLSSSFASRIFAIRIWPESDYTRVILEANFALKYYHFFSLKTPDRIVVDLYNVQLNSNLLLQDWNKQIHSYEQYLKLIRIAQFNPKKVRLVFEVKKKVKPKMFLINPIAGFKYRLVIDFYPDPVSVSIIKTYLDPILSFLEQSNLDKLNRTLSVRAKKIEKARASSSFSKKKDGPIIIMIDPGHGGEDPGAIGKFNTLEKDIVLQIAQRLKKLIKREPKMKVYMTRNEDIFIPLKVRVAKARNIQADLFISIHADAVNNREARGSSVFALSSINWATSNTALYLSKTQNAADFIGGVSKKGDKYLNHTLLDLVQTATINDSLKFGSEVLKLMGNINTLHKNVVEQASFAVLQSPDIPSILVETAFISNIEEEQKLKTAKFQQQLAESIFSGIKSYYKNIGKPINS